MSNIIFPEGVTWTQRYVTGGDFLTSGDSITKVGNLYHDADNQVIKIGFDTSNTTSINSMFSYCDELLYIVPFDTSEVVSMNNTFVNCSKLTTIPQLDTSNVTTMNNMFYSAGIRKLPLLDCSKISSGSYIELFASTTMTYLTDLGGFKDLGMVKGFNKPSYFLKYCPNLTKESILNVLNNLYDRKTAGYSVVTLPFHANALALLTDEEKAIATNKGWTLATS